MGKNLFKLVVLAFAINASTSVMAGDFDSALVMNEHFLSSVVKVNKIHTKKVSKKIKLKRFVKKLKKSKNIEIVQLVRF